MIPKIWDTAPKILVKNPNSIAKGTVPKIKILVKRPTEDKLPKLIRSKGATINCAHRVLKALSRQLRKEEVAVFILNNFVKAGLK